MKATALSGLVALAAALSLALSPHIALAQSATSTDDAGTTPTQRHQARGWRQSNELRRAISALGDTPVTALPIPILFGVAPADLTLNFGDPRDGGTRTHEGEDILAPRNTPIVSPTKGVILRTVTGSSEGNAVYEAAPGGYIYVYMHLDHFAEGVGAGTVVEPGALIGYVGNTGNAAGGPTHLHFEVHDASGEPVDPVPFLRLEFTPAQKISFLTDILAKTADPVALSQTLAANFGGTFRADEAQGLTLPPLITGALQNAPAAAASGSVARTLPPGDLDDGSEGATVIALQQFLIQRATGSAAARLARAGATGYFGPITQSALAEFQAAAGISPAAGYYGAQTRALVEGDVPLAVVPPPVNAVVPQAAATLSLTRDLRRGLSGQDVLALQQFLNAHGFAVAASGAGSVGEETDYFGPATEAAVIRFQQANAIEPSVGYVGPLTRAALSAAA